MQEVLRGYIGDRNSKAIFGPDTFMGKAFGVLGDGYQRPFELATVRLNNMIGSLQNCALYPVDASCHFWEPSSIEMALSLSAVLEPRNSCIYLVPSELLACSFAPTQRLSVGFNEALR